MKNLKAHANDCAEPCEAICTGKIDNISLVLSDLYPEADKAHTAIYVGWLKSGDLVQTKTSRNGYRRNAKFREEKYGGRVLISIMPVKPNAAPLRIEFNPAGLGPEKTEELVLDLVSELVWGGPKTFYEYARVTRVDIAFDLLGLSLGNLFAWSEGTIVNQVFQKDGMRTETIIQSYTKAKQLVVYDKAKEQLSKGLMPLHADWTRVEARARCCGYLTKLKMLKNPLLGFHLSHRTMPEGANADFWAIFDAACGMTTTQSILQKMTPKGRAKLKAKYLNSPVEVWNPEKLWADWPQIVEDSGLLTCKQLA